MSMIPESGNRRFDAVLCDVDGCLVHEGGSAFPLDKLGLVADYNREAMDKRDRPVVTLCTGRPVSFADCLSKVIGNTFLPVVAENGAWLYHAANNDWRLDPAVTHEHLDAVHDLSIWIEDRWASEGLRLQPGKTASISPYHEDPDFLPPIEPEIRAYCEEQGYPFRISSTWHYINCDLSFVSKATGIQRWQEWTGLKADRLAGIGDTSGDIAIAESVAMFGVPANRNPVIDSYAHIIAEHPEVDGVLQLLDRFQG